MPSQAQLLSPEPPTAADARQGVLGMHRWWGKTEMSKGRGHFLEREEGQVTLGLASQDRVFHKHTD